MDKGEFLSIVRRYVESQYEALDDSEEIEQESFVYLKSDSEIKKTIPSSGILDLTNVKSNQINDKLKNYNNIKIGIFLIKIISRRTNEVDLVIYESNLANNLIIKIDITKDNRFGNKTWTPYFNTFKFGHKIPMVKLIELIRWTQAIQKMSAFS